MNTYSKFCPNVFVSKGTEKYEKGETITVTTRRGKENECIVFNCIGTDREGNFYHSIVRADGFNYQEWAKRKAERIRGWQANASNKSTEYWKASHEGKDFLSLGEPIKVGHHSEKRHRALIERNWDRMDKSVQLDNKAKEYASRAEYWESKADTINLSMPESLEYYKHKLEEAEQYHKDMKDGKIERSHSYSLTYAKKEANKFKKLVSQAEKLWG